MEDFVQRLTALLKANFPSADVELETSGEDRWGGLLIWDGFTGHEQIERQRQVWQFLRNNLSPDEQRHVAGLLTLTHEETQWARQG